MNTAIQQLPELARQACVSGEFEKVEEFFLHLAEAPPREVGPVLRTADLLVESGRRALAVDLLAMLVDPLSKAGMHKPLLAVLLAIVPHKPDDTNLAVPLAEAYRKAYSEWAWLEMFLEHSGLEKGRRPLDAISDMRRFLLCREGAWFFHRAGWGVGRVMSVDPVARSVRIDFEHNPGHEMPIEVVADDLQHLPPGHFWVLRGETPERLRVFAEEDPAGLVRCVLTSFRKPLTVRELKVHLLDVAVPASSWSRWWNRAKSALAADPMVELPEKPTGDIALRSKPKSIQDEGRAALQSAEGPLDRLEVVRDYARRGMAAAEVKALAAEAMGGVNGVGPEVQLELGLGLGGLGLPGPDPDAILGATADPMALLLKVQAPDLQVVALDRLRALRPDSWAADFAAGIPELSREAREAAGEALIQAGEHGRVRQAMETVFRSKDAEAWIWMLKTSLGRHGEDVRPRAPVSLLNLYLDLLNSLSRGGSAENKKKVERLRSNLAAGRFRLLCEVLAHADPDEARNLVLRLPTVGGLSENQVDTATAIIATRFHRAVAPPEVQAADSSAVPDEYLLTTREAFERKREEFRWLVEDEIPKTTAEMGRARELGDLRENAEYHAAKEKLKLLEERTSQLEKDLGRARPLDADQVRTERVSVGCRVRATNLETGESRSFEILGPWDSDPDRGRISYRSPLAEGLIHHAPGEEVEIEVAGRKHRYRIDGIENALLKAEG